MSPFLALVKLTFRNAMRSRIFQLLLLILIFWVLLIPATVSGDGTVSGFLRVSLLYSLSGVGTLLSLSALWLGCYILTHDIDSYQIHMLVSKPVPRPVIWLGKFTGIYLLHLMLLLVSCGMVYVLVMYRYNRQDFSPEERRRMAEEVLVGRRVFMPKRADYDKLAMEQLEKREREFRSEGLNLSDDSIENRNTLLADFRKSAIARDSEIVYDGQKVFEYADLPRGDNLQIFLRYRVYAGSYDPDGQKQTNGVWYVEIPHKIDAGDLQNAGAGKQQEQRVFFPLDRSPSFPAGAFQEFALENPSRFITDANTARFALWNIDAGFKSMFIQPADGPKLLVKVTGFTGNYLRFVLVMMIELLILCGLGCAFGGILTLPTAIFVSLSYVLFGSFAAYIESNVANGEALGFFEQLGVGVSSLIQWVVIPLQDFELGGVLADGELLEFGMIGILFLKYFILRALPIMLIGIILYRRRELGLVLRK